MGTLFDHHIGTISKFSVTQFERGDIINFSLRPSISAGAFVFENDTIGTIYSNNIEREFVNLNSELKIAQALFNLNRKGEKKAIVRASEERYRYNLQKIEEHKKILSRIRQLYEVGLTTKEDYEIALGKLNLFSIDASIARAQLNATKTGVKAEELNLLRTRIETLEDKLLSLQKRSESFTITSQISGKITRVFSKDTLLMITDTSAYIVFIPVEWNQKNYLRKGQNVELMLNGIQKVLTGKLAMIDHSVNIINGKQMVFVSAIIAEYDSNIIPGMMIRSKIYCEPVTIVEYIKRSLQTVL